MTSYQSVNEEDNSSEGNSESTETPTPVLRPEAGSYVANLAAANTLFVMRLNDRAGETRYIDPVTEQERSSRLWLRQIGGHNAWRDSNIIFSIAFMLITLLVILIAKPSTGLGEVLVTINLLNALVWLAINLVNRLRERLVNHRDQQ